MSDAMASSSGQNVSDDGGILLPQWRSWTPEEVGKYFKGKGLSEEGDILTRKNISGRHLPQTTNEGLKKMGVSTKGKRLSVLELINTITRNSPTKVFNDSIHGHIEFGPLLIKIIDTPQFQRLRFIKQLGGCYFVFPGAAHNRFEHSLGVCYLAGKFARSLRRNQPELEITDKDIVCVQIAGLCHDLGHGPFSHMFDQFFVYASTLKGNDKVTHESLSVKMFWHLLKENNLKPELEKEFGLQNMDFVFIEELITGLPHQKQKDDERQYEGRGPEKWFLYEIVANEWNGIDVDKWDYFARDCYNLGMANSFDHKRYMKFARVIEVDGEKHICMRDKEGFNLYEMFNMRNTLHRRAYQHKVNKIIESMMVEALIKADKHLKIFPGAKGQKRTMSDSLGDMHAYTHLTDSVLDHILISRQKQLEDSKKLIQNIFSRKLYKYVGHSQPLAKTKVKSELEIKQQICNAVKGHQHDPEDLVVHVVKINYGKGKTNPLDYIRFYSKKFPNEAIKIRKGRVSKMLPRKFEERYIRLYCKNCGEENVKKAFNCFTVWCKEKRCSKPKPDNFLDSAVIPLY